MKLLSIIEEEKRQRADDEDEDDLDWEEEKLIVSRHSRSVGSHPPNIHSDFSRMARYISGKDCYLIRTIENSFLY